MSPTSTQKYSLFLFLLDLVIDGMVFVELMIPSVAYQKIYFVLNPQEVGYCLKTLYLISGRPPYYHNYCNRCKIAYVRGYIWVSYLIYVYHQTYWQCLSYFPNANGIQELQVAKRFLIWLNATRGSADRSLRNEKDSVLALGILWWRQWCNALYLAQRLNIFFFDSSSVSEAMSVPRRNFKTIQS